MSTPYSDYYIYALLDSSKNGKYIYGSYEFDYEPFYIGKGRKNRINDTLYDKSPFKKNKIDKLKRNNIEIIKIKIIENITNDEAIELEKEIISLIGRRDLKEGCLVNLTDGGDGRLSSKPTEKTKKLISKNRKGKGVGWKHSDKSKEIMSQKQKGEGNGFYGHEHTEETKEEHSNKVSGLNHPMYNKKHTSESIEKMTKARSKLSDEKLKESCQKFNKKVDMYSLSMKYIRSFESIKLAAIELGMNESIISKCCRGDIISPTRFYFKFNRKSDNIKNNRFLIKIGETFNYLNAEYILIKRNISSVICKDVSNSLLTIRYKDCDLLNMKETNDSDFIEQFIKLKNVNDEFKIDRKNHIIYNDILEIVIIYHKLNKHSDYEYKYNNKYICFHIYENSCEDEINKIIKEI